MSEKLTFDKISKILKNNKKHLKNMYVKRILVFGSVAREENNINSDIDFLVEFNKAVSLFDLSRLRRFLIDLFKCEVDVTTIDAIRKEFREEVLREAKVAA
jgi:uncharacterized protein